MDEEKRVTEAITKKLRTLAVEIHNALNDKDIVEALRIVDEFKTIKIPSKAAMRRYKNAYGYDVLVRPILKKD